MVVFFLCFHVGGRLWGLPVNVQAATTISRVAQGARRVPARPADPKTTLLLCGLVWQQKYTQ